MSEHKTDETAISQDEYADVVANIFRGYLGPLSNLAKDLTKIKDSLDSLNNRVQHVEQCIDDFPVPMYEINNLNHDKLGQNWKEQYEREFRVKDINKQLQKNDLEEINIDNMYYDMSGEKILIIFNHKHFRSDKYANRIGAEKDTDNLLRTFLTLGFRVDQHIDLTLSELWETLLKLKDKDHSKTSCICIAILTHGDSGGLLCAKDRSYEFRYIYEYFANLPTLANKPKMFFIQACRGQKMDYGIEIDDGVEDYDEITPVTPLYADTFVMHSSVEDYVSLRNMHEGSWMIHTLCSVLEKNYKDLDLLHIATIIQQEVASRVAYIPSRRNAESIKQIPETTFTFTKFLKFENQMLS